MDSMWDIALQLIGIGIFSFVVLDVYFLMPKRIRKLEASNDQRDIMKLRRIKWILDVLKLRQFVGFVLVLILVILVIDFCITIFF